MITSSYPITAAARSSSICRTFGSSARTSSRSIAGLRMSPSSPPVQHTSTVRTPWAWYLATVPAPLDDSSSGWAWTVSRQRVGSGTGRGYPDPRSPPRGSAVAVPVVTTGRGPRPAASEPPAGHTPDDQADDRAHGEGDPEQPGADDGSVDA